MPSRFPSSRISEIVAAPKRSLAGPPRFDRYGERGRKFEGSVEWVDGSFVNLRVRIAAGVLDDPTTFVAALILDGERIRGIDYTPIERRRHFRLAIPKGWHENVIDPNLPTNDQGRNRHVTVSDWEVGDLHSFVRLVATRWNIDFCLEETLL